MRLRLDQHQPIKLELIITSQYLCLLTSLCSLSAVSLCLCSSILMIESRAVTSR